MTTEKNDAREVAEWGLANTRFSVFSSTYTAFDEASFEELFGFPAESQTNRKAQFLSEFTTTREETVYKLSVVGPKIDVIISAGLQVGEVPKELPVLRNSEEIRAQLRRAAGSLIEKVHETRRLAVGEQMLMATASRVEGYKALARLLPFVKIDGEVSSDFFYRINRPRTLALDGRKVIINRLSQWTCLQLNVIMTAAEVSKTAICGDAVSLITDINSRGEDDLSSFTLDEKGQVVDKLVAFSKELAERGDCP